VITSDKSGFGRGYWLRWKRPSLGKGGTGKKTFLKKGQLGGGSALKKASAGGKNLHRRGGLTTWQKGPPTGTKHKGLKRKKNEFSGRTLLLGRKLPREKKKRQTLILLTVAIHKGLPE